MVVTWVISIAALGLASYSLYLQRRDKKPRLKVEAQLGVKPIELKVDDYGGHRFSDDLCMVITLRNPTEKDITVSEVYFVLSGQAPLKLKPWGNLPIIASHKADEVIIPRLNLMKAFSLKTKAKGYIQVKDMLGNVSSGENKHYDLANVEGYFPSQDEYYQFLKQRTDEKDAWEKEDS